jgi:hypothetical protein
MNGLMDICERKFLFGDVGSKRELRSGSGSERFERADPDLVKNHPRRSGTPEITKILFWASYGQ